MRQADRPAGVEDEARAHAGGQTLGRVHRRCRRVLGPDDPTTLLAAAMLTVALVRLGEAEPARVLREDTLQRCRRVLGSDHPLTLILTQVAVTDHPPLGDEAVEDDPSPRR